MPQEAEIPKAPLTDLPYKPLQQRTRGRSELLRGRRGAIAGNPRLLPDAGQADEAAIPA